MSCSIEDRMAEHSQLKLCTMEALVLLRFLLQQLPLSDGHKLILVEGIPTIFSWENIEQFDGEN